MFTRKPHVYSSKNLRSIGAKRLLQQYGHNAADPGMSAITESLGGKQTLRAPRETLRVVRLLQEVT
jgi:hypothetical protein